MTQKQMTLFDTPATAPDGRKPAREPARAPFRLRFYRFVRKILIGFILVSIANVLFSQFFYTPKMYRINRENRELMIRYRILPRRWRRSAIATNMSIVRSFRPTRFRSPAYGSPTPTRNTPPWPTTNSHR